jgi:hypothetical protein
MRFVIALFAAATCFAQIGAPWLGLLPDGSRLRTVYGIPGSAAASGGFDAGRDLGTIAVSPAQNYALATAAQNGAVLLVVPGQRAVPVNGVAASPDRIAISPSGWSAALWFAANGHVQIVSGLPSQPAVREVDSSFLGAISAMAVSDDASWIATVSSAGVYAIGANTVALPVESGVAALTFFANSPDLVMATSSRIFSLRDFSGNPRITSLYDSTTTLAPAGLAISTDNSHLALADASGVVYGIDLAQGGLAILDCGCSPEGVFPMGSAGFRLTGTSAGLVKFYDPAGPRIVVIPAAHSLGARLPLIPAAAVTAAAVPAVTINGIPATATLNQQLSMTISIPGAYSADITGTAVLTFATATSGDDQTIQFGTGGRSVNFTIPAGSTQANFSGASSVAVLTGTVAGTITITANVNGGSAATASVTTARQPPVISSVTLSQSTGALTVVVTGYTSTRETQTGVFSFSAGNSATIQNSSLTVTLAPAFAVWFSNSTSIATGGQFTLTMPFTVQGDSNNVVRVAVDLTNNAGISNVVSSK